jgi:hypothetical protein
MEEKKRVRKAKPSKQDAIIAKLLATIEETNARVAALEGAILEPAKAKKVSKAGQPRASVYYVLLSVPTANIQPQGITAAKILAMATDPTHISEKEAMELMEKHKALFGTRQPSWKVFRFYRPRLIEMNCLLMPNK